MVVVPDRVRGNEPFRKADHARAVLAGLATKAARLLGRALAVEEHRSRLHGSDFHDRINVAHRSAILLHVPVRPISVYRRSACQVSIPAMADTPWSIVPQAVARSRPAAGKILNHHPLAWRRRSRTGASRVFAWGQAEADAWPRGNAPWGQVGVEPSLRLRCACSG